MISRGGRSVRMRILGATTKVLSGSRRSYGHRRGYGLIEMMVAGFLASLLGILMALACATFARPALEVEARARIAQEATLATQSLACDLGGYLADSAGRTGDPTQYNFAGWNVSNPGVLLLNYQGASSGNTISITYELSGNQLVRYDSSTGVTTTIANHVTSFAVSVDPDNAAEVLIQFTISFRYFTASYTLIGVSPPT
jgi:type II secretory pathway component PulJ